MKLVIDESIEKQIVDVLKDRGYDIWYISDFERGLTDDKVLDLANSNNAVLITSDKDFGEIVFRKKMISTGILLFRFFGIPNDKKAELASRVLKEHGHEFMHAFTVVTPETIRIRKINNEIEPA